MEKENDPLSDRRKHEGEWHLDKRVVVGIIGAVVALLGILLTQTVTLIRWGSNVQSSIDQQRDTNILFAKRLDTLEASDRDQTRLSERVVRVETMLESVQHTVNKIDIAIDPVVRSYNHRNK